MDSIHPAHVLAVLSALGLPTLGILWKIARALARMEMKMDTLWQDYQQRIEADRLQARLTFERRVSPVAP